MSRMIDRMCHTTHAAAMRQPDVVRSKLAHGTKPRTNALIEIQDMRIFQRIAVLQNLSAVGAELGLTPGTISKRIQALEDALCVRLFERSTRSVRITGEGEIYRSHVDRILDQIDLAHEAVRKPSAAPTGLLKISAPVSLGQFIQPAMLEFMRAYPDVSIQVDMTDEIINLHEAGYDIAIRTGTLPESRLIAKRLLNDKIIVVAAPEYIRVQGRPSHPRDLTHHNCLVHGDRLNWHFRGSDGETEVKIAGSLRSNTGLMLQDAAIEGAGILRISELAVMRELGSGRLERLLPDHEITAEAGIWALYPSNKYMLPKVRVFLDFAAEYLNSTKSELLLSSTVGDRSNTSRSDRSIQKPRCERASTSSAPLLRKSVSGRNS